MERQKLAISDLRDIFADKHQRLLVERHKKKAQLKKTSKILMKKNIGRFVLNFNKFLSRKFIRRK